MGVPTFNPKIYTKLCLKKEKFFENKRRRSVIFENKEDNKNLSNPPAEGVRFLLLGGTHYHTKRESWRVETN